MEIIKFNKEYYQPIADGLKTQTLRLARKRVDVQEGEIAKAVFIGLNDTLLIRISKIGYKMFKSINLDDAHREGYDNVSDLKNALLKIYPDTNHWDRFYYYQFEVVVE